MKQLAFYQSPPRADALPLRERPVNRVAEAPTACNVIELLSALVGGTCDLNDQLAWQFILSGELIFGSLAATYTATATCKSLIDQPGLTRTAQRRSAPPQG